MSVETKKTEEDCGAESEGWRKSRGCGEQPKRAESGERTAGQGTAGGSMLQPQNWNLGKQDHVKLET